MFAILTILAVSGWPTTHVQVEATEPVVGVEAEALSARLADRLLDAGWTLAPLDREADARVFVSIEGDLARVSVEWGTQKHVSFVRQPIGQVLSLDVVHRVVESLESDAEIESVDAQTGTRVGLVFDADTPGRGEAAVLLRDEGFWVVPEQAPASWRICVHHRDAGYWIVRARALECAPPWADEVAVVPSGLRAAVSRQAEGIRFGTDPPNTDLDREMSEALDRTASLTRSAKPPPRPNPRILRTSAEGGFAGLRVIDPVVGMRLDVGRRSGVVGSFRSTFSPSSGEAFRAMDAFVTAGVKLRGNFGSYFDAWMGLSTGVLAHRFDRAEESVVTRVDPAIVVPVGMSFTTRKGVGLSLAVDQSYSIRDRRYIRDDQLLWERRSYRVGLTLAVHYERVVE